LRRRAPGVGRLRYAPSRHARPAARLRRRRFRTTGNRPEGRRSFCAAQRRAGAIAMQSVLYVGCPAAERPETERVLASASLSVVWADPLNFALSELRRRELPVLLDLSRGASALQTARELRAHRASTLMFAVVDARRPDLTTEALLAGMADVFARPL